MISQSYNQKHYNAAKHRFFKPVVINFFEREFPRLFGPVMREKLADELIKLFDALAPEASRLKPGQLLQPTINDRSANVEAFFISIFILSRVMAFSIVGGI